MSAHPSSSPPTTSTATATPTPATATATPDKDKPKKNSKAKSPSAVPSNDPLAGIITQVSSTSPPPPLAARRRRPGPGASSSSAKSKPPKKVPGPPPKKEQEPAPVPVPAGAPVATAKASSETGQTTLQSPSANSPPTPPKVESTTAAAVAEKTQSAQRPKSQGKGKGKGKGGLALFVRRFVLCSHPDAVVVDETSRSGKEGEGKRVGGEHLKNATGTTDGTGSTTLITPLPAIDKTSPSPVTPAPPAAKLKRVLLGRSRPAPSPSPSPAPPPVAVDEGRELDIDPAVVANESPAGVALSKDETGTVTSGAVMNPGAGVGSHTSVRRGSKSSQGAMAVDEADITTSSAGGATALVHDSADEDEDEEESDDESESERIIAQGGLGIPVDEEGRLVPLLVELDEEDRREERKCLVLDLDETLVHSSFKQMHADFIVPVEIESQVHNVYVIKRPGVDHFLRKMGEIYEVVVFTASLSKYADPVMDKLDPTGIIKHRLFRESCYNHKGNYVKDLSQLGREIGTTIIIDNSPASYIFHPMNAVPISSWFNDTHDTELTDLVPFLADIAGPHISDVRDVLDLNTAVF